MQVRVVPVSITHTDVRPPELEIDQLVPGVDADVNMRVPFPKALETRYQPLCTKRRWNRDHDCIVVALTVDRVAGLRDALESQLNQRSRKGPNARQFD